MDQTEDQQPEVAAEQAADLAALEAAAGGQASAAAAPAAAACAEPQPPSAAAMQIARMAVGMLRPLALFAAPSLREAPDELWDQVPEGVAAVLDHYGADQQWMTSPWARLAFSLAPLAAFAAVQAMNEPKKPQQALEPPAPPPGAPAVPGARTVTIGTVQAEGVAA